jgi:phage-related protein
MLSFMITHLDEMAGYVLQREVKTQALGFPEGILANFLHSISLVERFGPHVGLPYTRFMGMGLYEIRAKGKEGIGRALFCALPDRELVILNAFVKKSQKAPGRQLELARQRMKMMMK